MGDVVITATLLALTAAVLHAGWNLLAKRSSDALISLWAQFLVSGAIGGIGLAATGGVPAAAWPWAALSGLIHIPYLAGLGRAYEIGDFSLAYPLARGGGALLAAVGGALLLGDTIGPWAMAAIVTATAGMMLLAAGSPRHEIVAAVFVAVTIGAYTLADSHGMRTVDDLRYPLATFAATGVAVSGYGLAIGRGSHLVRALRTGWTRSLAGGVMAVVAYGLVMAAIRDAPVGYVAALRESSVLVAVVVGWRYLGERAARRRLVGAALIVVGLVVLVVVG